VQLAAVRRTSLAEQRSSVGIFFICAITFGTIVVFAALTPSGNGHG
jgi:hypothetical protein